MNSNDLDDERAAWKSIPKTPPVEVMEWYGDQFSAPVLLHDGEKVLEVVARWSFVDDGWVGSHFSDGPSPSDYEHLNAKPMRWLLLSEIARAASPQATATLSDAALRKLVIGVREFILGYLHSHVKDWPAPYDNLRSDAVTESLVTDARDQIATATQPAQAVYRSAILEEAAKVCDAREDWYLKDDCRGQACAAAGCANDIRALLAAAQPASGADHD